MKSIYLPIFESVNIDDVEAFLDWLALQTGGRISMAKLQRTTQVRATKLSPMLKLLAQFSLLELQPDAVALTANGVKFTRSLPAARKALMKNQFLTSWPMRDVLASLDAAGDGSLSKSEIVQIIKLGASMSVTDAMATGVMGWGHYCELVRFDREKQEISRIVVGPKSPVTPAAPTVRQSA